MHSSVKKSITIIPLIVLFILLVAIIFYNRDRSDEEIISNEIYQESKNTITNSPTLNRNPPVRPAIEWINNDEFVIYKGCGTECEGVYIFNIREDFRQKIYYGVRHTWSPNKKYVLAYHSLVQPGITVGDRYGNILFTLRREYHHELNRSHKASWSPDSAKLALISHQNNKVEMELLIFDVENDFQKTVQKQIQTKEEVVELFWKNENTVLYKDSTGEIFEEKI